MNSFTFLLQGLIKKASIFLVVLVSVNFSFSYGNDRAFLLQCPMDVFINIQPGECGSYFDFNTLVWSADGPLSDTIFMPGPNYFFPAGTTPVTLNVTDTMGNVEACSFNIVLGPPNNSVVCNNSLVVEFEGECTREITPFELLEGGPYGCEDLYTLSILSPLGADLGNVVDASFIGSTHAVKVFDFEGSICWGSLIVQSTGMPQVMACPADVTIFCHEPYDSVGLPIIEGCFAAEEYSHTHFDVKNNSFCDGDNVAFTVERKWTSADPMGNKTNCSQMITAMRVHFSDIDFPLNMDGVELPKLQCSDMVDVAVDADKSITGTPLVNGLDPTGNACNLAFLMSDSIQNVCGNHYVIKRKWQAFDYCLDEFFAHTQIIIIADDAGPEFSIPDTILFSNDNECQGTVLLPKIDLINECSGFNILVETPWETYQTDSVHTYFSSTPGFYNAIYTATDFCGNTSKDTIVVQVSAGLLAHCLDDINITADYYLENLKAGLDTNNYSVLNEFGLPEYFANCIFNPEQDVQMDLDACYEGVILRGHTVELNGDPIYCSQSIFVHHVSDFVVEFPRHYNGENGQLPTYECGSGIADFGEPIIFNETCELIAITYEDQVFTDVFGACLKIARTWSVINWCVVGEVLDNEVVEASELSLRLNGCLSIIGYPSPCDLNSDGNCDDRTFRDSWNICNLPDSDQATQSIGPDTDPDADPWDGLVVYEQIIKINDSEDPLFTGGCDIPDICITGNSCGVNLTLPTPDVDDCYADVNFTYAIRIGSIWHDGIGVYTNLAPGNYPVRYVAADNCNNQTACETVLKIVDCAPPVANCKSSVIADITLPAPPFNTPTVKVFAGALNSSSFDNCTGILHFSFSPNINDISRDFNCNNIGANLVELWVTDGAGNQNSCFTTVMVLDNISVCGGNPIFNGTIMTEEGFGIKGVEIEIENTTNTFSDLNGQFIFAYPNQFPFYIYPEKNDDPLNGLTTYDLVLLTRHILGVSLLDSPYKIIAADANRSNTVTTFDAVEFRKLILGINSEFPNNTSWRFVPQEYVFNNPNNPFSLPLLDTLWVNGPNTSLDFIGIKTGDLNGSASTDFIDPMDDRDLAEDVFLKFKNTTVIKGEIMEVPVFLANNHIIGFQTSILFDKEKMGLLEIKPGILSEQHFGKKRLKEGQLNISYNQNEPIFSDVKMPLFVLVIEAKNNGQLADWFVLSRDGISSEAYSNDLDIHGLGLFFENEKHSTNIFQMYPPQPNPFSEMTVLPFYLPESGEVKCTFFTPSGKVLKTVNSHFPQGNAKITITSTELIGYGLVLYRFETRHGSALGKLVIMN